jgi:carboxymethylenebutenolidase
MPDIRVNAMDGGSFSAYLAEPSGSARAPGIVVIQEIFGVNAVMRVIADKLAAQGYLALCPDLFWRQEPGIQITDRTDVEWQKAFELFKGFDLEKGVGDLIATLGHLRRMPRCSGKVGSVGYCLGGKLAYLMSTRSDSDCNVSYYGVGIEGLLGEAVKIRRPLLLHIAGLDQFVPPAAQELIRTGLAGNRAVSMHVYADNDHAFAREGGKHYSFAAAKLANDRSAAFFKQHLG